jgi:hypothetical protein
MLGKASRGPDAGIDRAMRPRLVLLVLCLSVAGGALVPATQAAATRSCGSVEDPDGWKVSGDLRPSHDTYVASKGSRRVRWRF